MRKQTRHAVAAVAAAAVLGIPAGVLAATGDNTPAAADTAPATCPYHEDAPLRSRDRLHEPGTGVQDRMHDRMRDSGFAGPMHGGAGRGHGAGPGPGAQG